MQNSSLSDGDMTNFKFSLYFKFGLFSNFFVLFFTLPAIGQVKEDSVRLLGEITVEAYSADRNPADVPASIGLLQQADLNRFSNSSLVPSFNMLPGVRMDERSPGSYRFSIRGSLLRSPFGVRNVKFYWNGLPLTDGGGNTYLNLLDVGVLGRAEVIKGPAASLYGAGTGGAVLLRATVPQETGMELTAQQGSFGALRYGAVLQAKGENVTTRIQFSHQQADGYRAQSALTRNSLNADMTFLIDPKNTLMVTLLDTDLSYQTPGGLTAAQYQDDPAQARPSTPSLPGAVQQQAAVYNKTFYSGVNFEHHWSAAWTTAIGLLGSTTDFKNPSIRNYETRVEKNIGARLTNEYEFQRIAWKGKITFGGEVQHFFSPIKVENNVGGIPGALVISNDEITSDLVMGFAQADADLPSNIHITLGASVNYLQYVDNRLAGTPLGSLSQKFNPVLSPRIALLKRFSHSLSMYASASHGFSPPTVAEVIPSTGVYNPNLKPETGWSYEVGMSGTILQEFDVHLAAYDFRLSNAIVIQRDASGADHFVNAGGTEQKGVELNAGWTKRFVSYALSTLRLYTSLTYNQYRFENYVNDGNDYSGNQITGVSPFAIAFGIDLKSSVGVYAQVTGNYVDRMPLNDANTAYASDYFLLGTRAGYRTSGRVPLDFFAGVDNILNQRYSLGNDLNASGGRYYNAAPTANYYVGISAIVPFGKGRD